MKNARISWRAWVSIAFALGFLVLYWQRPLVTEAITIWPSWQWLVPGVLFTFERKRLWHSLKWPLFAWAVVALGFSEIWRVVLPANKGGEIVVATVNCAGEMPGGMCELAALSPDVVLIQESAYAPSETDLVRETFGEGYEAVFGRDASIIVRGEILESQRPTTNHTFARVRLADGRELEVVSMRMQAPIARLDYYTADCWRAYTRHRVRHIEELKEIWVRVQKERSDLPLVMGGDFNLVPDPLEDEVLGPELRDSFRVAGRGWYATALSSTPIFRIDKVWASQELKPVSTSSHTSRVSDHRYVVARFDWADVKK